MRPPCVSCKNGAEKAGKLLKCLHKICLDCLAGSVEEDGKIRCSKCRRTTPCPPPARSHRQVLVDDSMFDNVPDSHFGTKKAKCKDSNLKVVSDESMDLSSIPQEATSSHVVRSTIEDAEGFHQQMPHQGRVHVCPYHSTMELQYYCTRCREVLCKTCKAQIKHASHIDQVNDGTEVATALNLMERLRKIVPDGNEKEVNESLEYAGDLLTAFECDSATQVSSIKTMIHEEFLRAARLSSDPAAHQRSEQKVIDTLKFNNFPDKGIATAHESTRMQGFPTASLSPASLDPAAVSGWIPLPRGDEEGLKPPALHANRVR